MTRNNLIKIISIISLIGCTSENNGRGETFKSKIQTNLEKVALGKFEKRAIELERYLKRNNSRLYQKGANSLNPGDITKLNQLTKVDVLDIWFEHNYRGPGNISIEQSYSYRIMRADKTIHIFLGNQCEEELSDSFVILNGLRGTTEIHKNDKIFEVPLRFTKTIKKLNVRKADNKIKLVFDNNEFDLNPNEEIVTQYNIKMGNENPTIVLGISYIEGTKLRCHPQYALAGDGPRFFNQVNSSTDCENMFLFKSTQNICRGVKKNKK